MRQRRPRTGSDNRIKCRTGEPSCDANRPRRPARRPAPAAPAQDRPVLPGPPPKCGVPPRAAARSPTASLTSRPASITSIVGTIRSGPPPARRQRRRQPPLTLHGQVPRFDADRRRSRCDQPGQRLVVGLLHHDQVHRAIRGQRRRHLGVAAVGDQHNAVGLDHGTRRRAVKAGEPGDVGRCGHDQPRDAGLGHELAGSNVPGPQRRAVRRAGHGRPQRDRGTAPDAEPRRRPRHPARWWAPRRLARRERLFERGNRARQLRVLSRKRLRATICGQRVGGVAAPCVNLRDAFERGQVLGRRGQDRRQLGQRGVELALVEQRATQRRTSGGVFGVKGQAGPAGLDRLVAAGRRAGALRRGAQKPATPDPAGSGVATPECEGCPPRWTV